MSTTTVQDSIERTVELTATPERVWAALTEPDQLGQWFHMTKATVDLREGGECSFAFSDPGQMRVRALLTAVEPPRYLAWQWALTGKDDPSKPVLEQANLTSVAFTLEGINGGTRLTVVESGFASFDQAMAPQAYKSHSGGWEVHIGNLANWLTNRPLVAPW